MIIHTASEGISLAKKLENESSAYYRAMTNIIPSVDQLVSGFVKENEKFISNFQRAYFGVISDALEGCFTFELESNNYVLETSIHEKSMEEWPDKAIKMEKTILQFYLEAGEQMKSLLPDVSRAFLLIAKKRNDRISNLVSMLPG